MNIFSRNRGAQSFRLVPAWQSAQPIEQEPRLGHRSFGILCMAITPDGRFALSLNYQYRELIIWDFETGQRVDRGNWAGYDKVHWMYLTPDGACAMVVGETGGTVGIPSADPSQVEAWRQRRRPSGEYVSVAANGRRALVNDGEMRVWDFENHCPGVTLPRPAGKAGGNAYYRSAPVISPDGRYGFCRYGCLMVGWDLDRGELIWQREAINDLYVPLVLGPNPKQILVGMGFKINCWNWETDQLEEPDLPARSSRSTALAFTPDGSRLISGHYDGSICIWRWPSGILERVLGGHDTGAISQLAVSPDGAFLLSGGGDTSLRKWRIDTGEQIFCTLKTQGTPDPLSIPSQGGIVITPYGCDRATLAVRDLATGEIRTRLEGHQGNVNVLTYLEDGKHLLTGANDQTVRHWDLTTGRCLGVMYGGHAGQVMAISTGAKGTRLVSGAGDGSIVEWDLRSGALIRKLLQYQPPDSRYHKVYLDPGLNWALTGVAKINPQYINYDAFDWYVWNLDAGTERSQWYGTGAAHAVVGHWFVQVSGLKYNQVDIVDLLDGKKKQYGFGYRVDTNWAVLPDQEMLYTTGGFFDPKTGQVGGAFETTQGRITAAAVSQDRKFAVTCADLKVKLWDLKSRKELAMIEVEKYLFSLAIDPMGGYIIGGNEDMRMSCFRIERQ